MFFIVGMGRSGTTLLKTLFDHHPHAINPPETKIILALRHDLENKKLTVKDVDRIMAHLELDRKIKNNWGMDLEALEKDLKTMIATGASFEDVCKCIYLHHPLAAEKPSIHLIGDKNPGYTMNVEWLHKTFKNARFIHIIRDYRDCISSHNRVFKKRHVSVLANAWVQFNQKLERMAEKYPSQFITIRYEDLSTNPEPEIKRLCAFLGLEFNDNMFNYSERFQAGKESGVLNVKAFEKTHADLFKPIHSQNIGKYKKYMSAYQIRLVEYTCNKKGLTYGYTPTQTPVSAFNLWYPFIAFVCKLRFKWTHAMIALYYASPFWMRHALRKYTDFMHRKFKYTNRYNNAELMYQQDE